MGTTPGARRGGSGRRPPAATTSNLTPTDSETTEPVVTGSPAARRVGDEIKRHRRQLMAAELEGVALDLFAEHGYGAVSVDDIAVVAGVSARTFYRYFATKEDVLVGYPRRMSARVRAMLEDQPPDRSLFDALAVALLRFAGDVDLDELRRWWTVVGSDRRCYGAVAVSQLELRRDLEPLFVQYAEQPDDALHIDLALNATYIAMTSASTTWCAQGGDFVALVRTALDVFAQGFSRPRP